MTKRLIIADSAAKIALLTAYYGDNTTGTLCQWPLFRTSFKTIVEGKSTEIFHFEALPEAEELCATLNANLDREIILAFDGDAKGELLSWQIGGYASQIGAGPDIIKRLKPTGFSRHEIDSTLQAITSPDTQIGQAAYSRLIFDDYLGRHLQRLLGTDRGPGNVLLRHHSLTILFMLNDRQYEQRMNRHIPKWQIIGQVEGAERSFPATLTKGLDIPTRGLFSDQGKALSLTNKLKTHPLEVDSVIHSPLKIAPPPPYHLPELAQDALTLLGLNLIQVAAIVTKLYHGVDHQGEVIGLISSPFPGTNPPATATIATLRDQVSTLYGKSNLGEQIDLSTGMIVPLLPHLDGTNFIPPLNQDETSLYKLIWTRAIASQMKPAVGESSCLDFLVNRKYGFQSHFHELTDYGFLQILPEQISQWQVPCPLAGIEKGQKFNASLLCQPSPREGQGLEPYTIESLFAELADFSIVPDADTVTLLGNLAALGYLVASEQGFLAATSLTNQVVTIVGKAFPKMQGLNLAAYIEQTINEAVTGRKNLSFALKQFDQTLMLHGKTLIKPKLPPKTPASRPRTSATIIKQTVTRPVPEKTSPPPDTSESSLSPQEADISTPEPAIDPSTVALPSQEDQFPSETEIEATQEEHRPTTDDSRSKEVAPPLPDELECDEESQPESTHQEPLAPSEDLLKLFADALVSSTPEAETTEQQPTPSGSADHPPEQPQKSPINLQGKECPTCGQAMTIMEDHFGTYWRCTGFPTCRYSETAQELPCPQCGHILTKKQTSTGKHFFACEDSDCQFMSWSAPHYLPCGLCDAPYLVEKIVQGSPQLRCPRAGCSYAQPFPEQPTENEPPQAGASPKKVVVRRAVPGTGKTTTGTKKVRVVRRRS